MEFYVQPSVAAGYTMAFGNIWLQWVTGGMYVGLRRIVWSIQVMLSSSFVIISDCYLSIDYC